MRKMEFNKIEVERDTLLSIVDACLHLDVRHLYSTFSNASMVIVTVKSLPNEGIQILNIGYTDDKVATEVTKALVTVARELENLKNVHLIEGTILYRDHKRKEVKGLYMEDD